MKVISATFPLTLTLSLGEREQRLNILAFSNIALANPAGCQFMALERILPLPEGEGRGEGQARLLNPKITTSQTNN